METALHQLTNSFRAPLRALLYWTKQMCVRLLILGYRYRRLTQDKLPQHIRRILVVCKGNICRSPLAEAYLRTRLQEQGYAVSVRSAGLETSLGKPAHPLTKHIGEQYGFSMEAHKTQPLLKEFVEEADLILVMEFSHLRRLLKVYPEAEEKIFLLGQSKGNAPPLEITDPYNGTLQDFQHCFQKIKESCDHLIQRIWS